MTLSTVAVLRPGDWVLYDGSEHQVLALAGTSVRLRTVDGADSVVLAGHLMASPGFAVVDSEPAPSVEPFALLDGLPGAVLDTAREWERHVVEIETGLPPGAEPGVAPKPEYNPTSTTVVDPPAGTTAETDCVRAGCRGQERQLRPRAARRRAGLIVPGRPVSCGNESSSRIKSGRRVGSLAHSRGV